MDGAAETETLTVPDLARRASTPRATLRRLALSLRRPWPGYALVTLAGVTLRGYMPPVLRWNQPHDDTAQVRIARALLDGQWLGEWGSQPVPHITLAKGPGYPLFLAAIHPTGLTPPLAAYLLYLAGGALLATALRRHIGRWWALVLYAAVAFNPLVFSGLFSVVYRENLVAGLAMLALGLAAHLGQRLARPRPWRWRVGLVVAVEALTLGAVIGLGAVTRVDTVWVMCGALGAVVVGLLPVLRRLRLRGWLVAGAAAALVGAVATLIPTAVAITNERHYGVRLVDDFSEGAFQEAITAWASVRAGDAPQTDKVGRPQREAVYAVSATARLLEPVLENPKNGWIGLNCRFQEALKDTCDDLGTYFAWALRDAAVQQGGIRTAVEFQQFFARLHDEISGACATGALDCGMPGLSSGIEPADRLSRRTLVSSAVGLVGAALTFDADGPLQAAPRPTDPVDVWLTTVNEADFVTHAMAEGVLPTALGQESTANLLSAVYRWWALPLFMTALVLLFTRRMWTTTTGRMALVMFGAWLTHVAILTIFYASANRATGGSVPHYAISSEGYLAVGLVLTARFAWGAARDALPRGASVTVPYQSAP